MTMKHIINGQQYLQPSVESYNVAVNITLPKDFSDWPSSGNALTVDFNTGQAGSADNSLDVTLYQRGDTSGVPVAFRNANYSNTGAKTWQQVTFTRADFEGAEKWDATHPNSRQVTLYLNMHAKNNIANYVQVGDISINYLSAF